jgi:hypothetical protein
MKFIVIFRDPTKRAKSHFEMVTSLDGTPEQIENRGKEWINFTIEEVIELDLRNMKESGLIPYWNNESKTIDMELFRQFVGSKQEDEAFTMYMKDHIPMGNGSHSLVSRGLYELQLRQWMRSFPPDSFLALKLEDMKVQGVNETMKKVWKHLELPEFEVEDESAKNTRAYSELNCDTREMLERFYEPHNARLESLLGEEWSNPW